MRDIALLKAKLDLLDLSRGKKQEAWEAFLAASTAYEADLAALNAAVRGIDTCTVTADNPHPPTVRENGICPGCGKYPTSNGVEWC